MTKPFPTNPNRRPEGRIAPTHLYWNGQIVRKKRGIPAGIGSTTETCQIVATLPAAGNLLQDRMRSDNGHCDRIAAGDQLEPAFTPLSGIALIFAEEAPCHG